MDEWAKVVIYPLGLVGFALLLLYRVHASADKRRQSGQEPRPARILTSAAVISLLSGLTLAFLELRTPPVSAHERQPPREAAEPMREKITRSPNESPRSEPPVTHTTAEDSRREIPESNEEWSPPTRVSHASLRQERSDEQQEAQQQLRNIISSVLQSQQPAMSRVCQTAVARCTFPMPNYVGSVCTCIVPNLMGYPMHYPGAFVAQ